MRRPKVPLGQHFLTDMTVVGRIVQAIRPQVDDCMFEIGPGKGVLTKALLDSGLHQLKAIEIDGKFCAALQQWQEYPKRLQVIHQDALSMDWAALDTGTPVRITGNLAYNISTPLLLHLAAAHNFVSNVHVMVQKEVAERIVAPSSCKQYSRFSVMMQLFFDAHSLFDVPPECFFPRPAVFSSFIRLSPKRKVHLNPHEFRKLSFLLRTAFSARRKKIANSLSTLISRESFLKCKVCPMARADEICPDSYLRLLKCASMSEFTPIVKRGSGIG